MYKAVIPVLVVMDDQMWQLDNTAGGPSMWGVGRLEETGGLEKKWEEDLREVAKHVDGLVLYDGVQWSIEQLECM